MATMILLCKFKDWIASEVVSLLLALSLRAVSSRHAFPCGFLIILNNLKVSRNCTGVPLRVLETLPVVVSSGRCA